MKYEKTTGAIASGRNGEIANKYAKMLKTSTWKLVLKYNMVRKL